MQNFHPLFVHFPIALLLTAWALTVAGWCLRREALHRVATWNLALGAVGAAASVWTGLRAEPTALPHSFEIHEVMELHERLGIAVLCGAAALLAWRAIRRAWWPTLRLEQMAQIALLTAVAGMLAWGGLLGGRLVFEYGVGTNDGAASAIEIIPHAH